MSLRTAGDFMKQQLLDRTLGAGALFGLAIACTPAVPPAECPVALQQPCACPGGHVGAEECDSVGMTRCVCMLQWPSMQAESRALILLDQVGQEIRRVTPTEPVESVALFLPTRGLFVATQRTSGCGEDFSAFSLATGQPVLRLTTPGECLHGFFPDPDGNRLFVFQAGDYPSNTTVASFALGGFGEISEVSRVDLGSGYAHSDRSAAVDDHTLVVPLIIENSTQPGDKYIRFLRVDVESGNVRELFVVPVTEWIDGAHATDGVYAVGVYQRDTVPQVREVRVYDAATGALLQSVPGALLSSQGTPIVVRDDQGQVRTWQPWQSSALSSSLGAGGAKATLAQDALALTGMGTGGLETWAFDLATGERTLVYDGALDLAAGEWMIPEVRFIAPRGAGLLETVERCQGDVCHSGSVVLLRTDRPRADFWSMPIRNSSTLVLSGSTDPTETEPYLLSALDPASLDVAQVRRFTPDQLAGNFLAAGLDTITW